MLQASLTKLLMDARIRLVVLLVVLVLLAQQLAILFWQFYPQPKLSNTAVVNTVALSDQSGNLQQSRREQADAIANSHLFGQAFVEQVTQQVIEQAPETSLNYKLRGIYFSEEASVSSAIVEVKPNDSQHYYIDDELAENITLSAIARDHILINRYGKIERLNLQKPVVSKSDSVITTRTAINSAGSTRLLQSYKKRYVSNPLALAKRFQAIPVQENGRNIGFRLKALRGESLLKKLDFDENDVFTKVNGISLDKPFQALDALKSLATANSVSVTILRNGSEQTMDFSL